MSEAASIPAGGPADLSAGREAVPSTAWRCFHCDEVFTDAACAELHFGKYQDCEPICTVGAARYRDLEDQLADYRSEADAASKTFYEMGARHAGLERRAEEKGYERGLRDARAAEPPQAVAHIVQVGADGAVETVEVYGSAKAIDALLVRAGNGDWLRRGPAA